MNAYYYMTDNNYMRAIPIQRDSTYKMRISSFRYAKEDNSVVILSPALYDNYTCVWTYTKTTSDGMYWTWPTSSTQIISLKTYSSGGIGFIGTGGYSTADKR